MHLLVVFASIHDADIPLNVSVAQQHMRHTFMYVCVLSAHLFQLHFMSHGIEASFISYLTYYSRSILNTASLLALHSFGAEV